MWSLVTQTFREFIDDECPRLAAALTYYTFFSLPALLVAIVYIAGLLLVEQVDRNDIAGRLQSHFEETIGKEGAGQIMSMLQHATNRSESGPGWLVGMGMLLLGATGALQELQTAMNRAWSVEPDPARGGFRRFMVKRLLSLALLLTIAALLIASLAVSWIVAAFGQWMDAHPSVWIDSHVMRWIHTGASLAIFTILFAVLFRYLPDAKIDWSDVWLGAVVTTLLFWLGQGAISMYLAFSKPTSAYGAAGSLALVLLWLYYSAMIFFFGAEFTQVVAKRRGKEVIPTRGARLSAPSVNGTSPQ